MKEEELKIAMVTFEESYLKSSKNKRLIFQ
jgi:hypothetical protein